MYTKNTRGLLPLLYAKCNFFLNRQKIYVENLFHNLLHIDHMCAKFCENGTKTRQSSDLKKV